MVAFIRRRAAEGDAFLSDVAKAMNESAGCLSQAMEKQIETLMERADYDAGLRALAYALASEGNSMGRDVVSRLEEGRGFSPNECEALESIAVERCKVLGRQSQDQILANLRDPRVRQAQREGVIAMIAEMGREEARSEGEGGGVARHRAKDASVCQGRAGKVIAGASS